MIQSFLQQVTSTHKTGAATEHSYRPALQALFQSLSNDITAINEPKRVACGAPDFISQRPQSISSPEVLANMMAGKAQLIKDVFAKQGFEQ